MASRVRAPSYPLVRLLRFLLDSARYLYFEGGPPWVFAVGALGDLRNKLAPAWAVLIAVLGLLEQDV